MDAFEEQERVCRQHGVARVDTPPDMVVGVARNVSSGQWPINGLRHPPEGGATGWYIWAGEVLSTDDDFFAPLHVEHLDEWCPGAIRFLGLPPGWRFLFAEGYEDVWFDAALLDVSSEP